MNKTPLNILDKFEKAKSGLNFGTVSLTYSIKNGTPPVYFIERKESFLLKDNQSSSGGENE